MVLQAPRTIPRPSTRAVPTAHLAQTMSLLSLTIQELREKIETELSENPALEYIEERRCPTCRRRLPATGDCQRCSFPQENQEAEPIVFVSPKEDFSFRRDTPSEDMPEDNLTTQSADLASYVLRQIAPELDPTDRPLAAHILTSLDEDGLLSIPIVEIARYHHALPSRVSEVLNLIQRADPIGVASPTPQDALKIQLEILSERYTIPDLAIEAIDEGMDLLSRHQYVELGRLLKVPTHKAKEIAQFISDNLNPFPGRAHWGDQRQKSEDKPAVYHQPDVIISTLEDTNDSPLVIEIVWPISGTLRVNPMFRKALQDAPQEKADQWKSDIERASLFVKCLFQRTNTVVRLMKRLAEVQRSFILQGDAHLAPITRAKLAKELSVHESTISRAVSGKTAQLPNGKIIPISRFFDRSLHIRTALKEIIANEGKPLSDTELAKRLGKKGHKVARRTVAKYRAMEGILPAHLRRSLNTSVSA